MAKQNQATEAKSDKKTRPKVEPTVVEERSGELAGLAQLPGGPMAAVGGSAIEAQAARLGDPRLQTAQRQALAAQIGRGQGNQHLQRVVASLKPDEKIASPTPARRQGPGSQGGQGRPRSGVIQAKLTTSQPGDKYEREADWVAERVMPRPEPGIQRKPT